MESLRGDAVQKAALVTLARADVAAMSPDTVDSDAHNRKVTYVADAEKELCAIEEELERWERSYKQVVCYVNVVEQLVVYTTPETRD